MRARVETKLASLAWEVESSITWRLTLRIALSSLLSTHPYRISGQNPPLSSTEQPNSSLQAACGRHAVGPWHCSRALPGESSLR